MTITLIPEVESAVCEAARRQGTTPDQVANETLKSLLPPTPETLASEDEERERRKQEALARIQSGYYARLLGPSRLMQDKAEERAREERRWKTD